VAKKALKIQYGQSVTGVTRKEEYFEVKTQADVYTTATVVLAIGKDGNPRKLTKRVGESEEEVEIQPALKDQVRNALDDPRNYADQAMLIVGAGDSAAEVALALSEQGNHVVMACRTERFDRMNESLREKVYAHIASHNLTAYYYAQVKQITKDVVTLRVGPENRAEDRQVPADWVFLQIGAEAPKRFLQSCGVQEYEEDQPILGEWYEPTGMPGLYLIGAVGSAALIKDAMNQGYEVIEYLHDKQLATHADEEILQERLKDIPGDSAQAKLASIASTVPLLQEVSNKQLLRKLARRFTVLKFDGKGLLLKDKKETFDTTLYTIIEGSVEIAFPGDQARRFVLGPGECFGEMGALADRRLSYVVTAAAGSILLGLDRLSVLELVEPKRTPKAAKVKQVQEASAAKRLLDETYVLHALQWYLYPDLKLTDIHTLMEEAELQYVEQDETIFDEDDLEDAFYIGHSGLVKISAKNRKGREVVIGHAAGGEYFGERALLDEARDTREATATAMTRTEVFRMPKDAFFALLKHYPSLKQRMQDRAKQYTTAEIEILERPETAVHLERLMQGTKKGKSLSEVPPTDILLIDESKCIRCNNCVAACAATHEGQTRLERVSGKNIRIPQPGAASVHIHLPVACRHCEGAPCTRDCPSPGAIGRDPYGVVRINEHDCIKCGQCASACPYGVILMVEPKPHESFFTSLLDLIPGMKSKAGHQQSEQGKKPVKCDLCEDIVGGPACVRSCPTGAAIRVDPWAFTQTFKV